MRPGSLSGMALANEPKLLIADKMATAGMPEEQFPGLCESFTTSLADIATYETADLTAVNERVVSRFAH